MHLNQHNLINLFETNQGTAEEGWHKCSSSAHYEQSSVDQSHSCPENFSDISTSPRCFTVKFMNKLGGQIKCQLNIMVVWILFLSVAQPNSKHNIPILRLKHDNR